MNDDSENTNGQLQTPPPTPVPVPPSALVPPPPISVKKPFLTRITWHPMFGIIVGLIIAAYFYYAGLREPELTFYVSPTRVPLVQLGGATNYLEVQRLAPIREFIQVGVSSGTTNTFILPAHAYLE